MVIYFLLSCLFHGLYKGRGRRYFSFLVFFSLNYTFCSILGLDKMSGYRHRLKSTNLPSFRQKGNRMQEIQQLQFILNNIRSRSRIVSPGFAMKGEKPSVALPNMYSQNSRKQERKIIKRSGHNTKDGTMAVKSK